VDSLVQAIDVLSAGIVLLQETKLYRQGKLELKGFIIFEKLRKYGCGGGLLTAIHENLNPILVENDEELTDILVVDIKPKNDLAIRIFNCYGPQEYQRKKNDPELDVTEDNKAFFLKLQTEIKLAKQSDKHICIQMDANSKFGKDVIQNDPNENMSENGKILFDLIKCEDLVLVNSTNKCYGTVTRYRKTVKRTERAAIDFFILCRRLYEMLVKMTIDKERNMVMKKFSMKNGEKKITESDHNLMWCEFRLQWSTFIKKDRMVAFKFKDLRATKHLKHIMMIMRKC
jgi:hypothetical protein